MLNIAYWIGTCSVHLLAIASQPNLCSLVTQSGMGGGDNGCGSGCGNELLSYIPQTEQHLPFGLVLFCLGECHYLQ